MPETIRPPSFRSSPWPTAWRGSRRRAILWNASKEWSAGRCFGPCLPAVEARRPGGRPAYDRLLLCKILVLERLYQPSDEAVHFQILDRLSFQRFLGLSLADRVPDQNTGRSNCFHANSSPHRPALYASP